MGKSVWGGGDPTARVFRGCAEVLPGNILGTETGQGRGIMVTGAPHIRRENIREGTHRSPVCTITVFNDGFCQEAPVI